MRKILLIGIVILATFTSVSCIVFQPPDYIVGRENFLAGNYSQAFSQLISAAQMGNPNAQYAIGYMYYYGLGIVPDRQVAMVWIQRAANQGQPQAIQVLDSLLNGNNSLAKPELLPRTYLQSTPASSSHLSTNSGENSNLQKDEQSSSDLSVTRTIKQEFVETADMQPTHD